MAQAISQRSLDQIAWMKGEGNVKKLLAVLIRFMISNQKPLHWIRNVIPNKPEEAPVTPNQKHDRERLGKRIRRNHLECKTLAWKDSPARARSLLASACGFTLVSQLYSASLKNQQFRVERSICIGSLNLQRWARRPQFTPHYSIETFLMVPIHSLKWYGKYRSVFDICFIGASGCKQWCVQ